MTNLGRDDLAKNASSTVINTLTNADWIGLVYFNTLGYKFSNQLERATAETKTKYINKVNSLIFSGSTDYEEGFNKAFEMLKATTADEYGSACNNVMLFLTDGDVSKGKEGTDLINHIKSLQGKTNTTIFTFSLGLFLFFFYELRNEIYFVKIIN